MTKLRENIQFYAVLIIIVFLMVLTSTLFVRTNDRFTQSDALETRKDIEARFDDEYAQIKHLIEMNRKLVIKIACMNDPGDPPPSADITAFCASEQGGNAQ